jgi:hypothetical protein
MKIAIWSTSRLVTVKRHTGEGVGRGTTDQGVRVHALITRIAADRGQNLAELELDLEEHAAPSREAVECFPLRLLL